MFISWVSKSYINGVTFIYFKENHGVTVKFLIYFTLWGCKNDTQTTSISILDSATRCVLQTKTCKRLKHA